MHSVALHTKTWLAAASALLLLAQPVVSAHAASTPSIIQPDGFTWAPAAGLPDGAKVTVLYGDPGKAGPFAVRFQFDGVVRLRRRLGGSHPTRLRLSCRCGFLSGLLLRERQGACEQEHGETQGYKGSFHD